MLTEREGTVQLTISNLLLSILKILTRKWTVLSLPLQ